MHLGAGFIFQLSLVSCLSFQSRHGPTLYNTKQGAEAMTHQNAKTEEMSFVANAGDVTIKVNGVSVEIHTDGSILACTNGIVKVCPLAHDDESKGHRPAKPEVGDKMLDGTIYAGISPDTNKPMYATPADASLTMTFNAAQEYAAKLDAQGHKDWRVPTREELNVLFNNRAAIGGFNVTGSFPAGWYWSASPDLKWHAWCQRLSDGAQLPNDKYHPLSVRPVR
jgi:hypothetical protein